MKFWDSSAIIPLLVRETPSRSVREILSSDRQIHVWWGSDLECVSAIARLEREGIAPAVVEAAFARLRLLRQDWSEILPGPLVRETAKRLLRVHPLRSADAIQLASAAVLADGDPESVPFVCLDERLRSVARREGHPLLP